MACTEKLGYHLNIRRYVQLSEFGYCLHNDLSVTKIGGRLSRSGQGRSCALKAIAPWVIIRQYQLPTAPRSATMTSNSAERGQHVQEGFQVLVA
jgi:hypothetical protein